MATDDFSNIIREEDYSNLSGISVFGIGDARLYEFTYNNMALNSIADLGLSTDYTERHSRGAGLRETIGESQEALGHLKLAVMGNGAVGSNIASTAMRAGVQEFILADNDLVERSNLSTQVHFEANIGKNKSESLFATLKATNQNVRADLYPEGLTLENIDEIVDSSDIVVDAIDIEALDMIFCLHEKAAKARKPVVVGYDIGTVALIVTYNYHLFPDREVIEPMFGDIDSHMIEEFKEARSYYQKGYLSKKDWLLLINDMFKGPVPINAIPSNYMKALMSNSSSGNHLNQLPETSAQLGALATREISRLTTELANSQPIKVRPSEKNIRFKDTDKNGVKDYLRNIIDLVTVGWKLQKDLGVQANRIKKYIQHVKLMERKSGLNTLIRSES